MNKNFLFQMLQNSQWNEKPELFDQNDMYGYNRTSL